MAIRPTKRPIFDSIKALESDAEQFARTINKLHNMAYEIDKLANELQPKLRTFCTFIDDLKAHPERYAPDKSPIPT